LWGWGLVLNWGYVSRIWEVYVVYTDVVRHLLRQDNPNEKQFITDNNFTWTDDHWLPQTSGTKKPTVTADSLYGAWADSLKDQSGGEGVILGTENDFYFIWNGNISGGDNFDANIKLTYNLKLDKDPIEVEIISKYVDTDKIKKRGLATIEVIDNRHIIWKMLDESGKVVDSARLTKAPNQ
jgi:hypothetical protein